LIFPFIFFDFWRFAVKIILYFDIYSYPANDYYLLVLEIGKDFSISVLECYLVSKNLEKVDLGLNELKVDKNLLLCV
jgi:hypothetical protein